MQGAGERGQHELRICSAAVILSLEHFAERECIQADACELLAEIVV